MPYLKIKLNKIRSLNNATFTTYPDYFKSGNLNYPGIARFLLISEGTGSLNPPGIGGLLSPAEIGTFYPGVPFIGGLLGVVLLGGLAFAASFFYNSSIFSKSFLAFIIVLQNFRI